MRIVIKENIQFQNPRVFGSSLGLEQNRPSNEVKINQTIYLTTSTVDGVNTSPSQLTSGSWISNRLDTTLVD